jgi:hexosaminidase
MIDYARYDHGTVSDMYLAYLCETRQSESFSRVKVMIRDNSECVRKSRILQGALTIAALTIMIGQLGNAQQAPKLSVMPLPKSVETGQGEYKLDGHFHAGFSGTHDARLDEALSRFLVRLNLQCGGVRRVQYDAKDGDPLTLTLAVAGPGGAVQGFDEDESYKLNVTSSGVALSAATDVGAMHGLETFLQLATMRDGACSLPAVTIDDAPRFAWRGFELDVVRHFEPVSVIERTLDGMAVAKLNVFHWHLSDDQGFRAESKKFPRLTEVASLGQFYTQDEMRHIVAYARARGIRVVPEFDVPGHSATWVFAYPELGDGRTVRRIPQEFQEYEKNQGEMDPTKESTYKFLDTFIGEMAEIFPDAYFHIGGDEVDGSGWKTSASIQEFMQKKGFKTKDDLQAYFNQRLLPIVQKHGKKMVGWDEILNPALPKDIVVQSWRGEESLSAGAVQGYTGILSAPYYLDGEKTSEEMFLADPIPADTKLTPEEQKKIIGGEVCMWAEQLYPETVDSRVWPRTVAVAERFWSQQNDRDVADMYRRLRIVSLELEEVGLTHITGPEKMRRSLVESTHTKALNALASVTEPVSFGDREDVQHTDALTPLNGLVDAVVADPPARQEIAAEVDAVVNDHSKGAEAALRERFLAWQQAAPELLVLTQKSGRFSEVGPRVEQLAALAGVGLESLAYLDARTAPPAGWLDKQKALLKNADQPGALVKFVFLPSLGKLAESAATR